MLTPKENRPLGTDKEGGKPLGQPQKPLEQPQRPIGTTKEGDKPLGNNK